jgi:hypothetical protein
MGRAEDTPQGALLPKRRPERGHCPAAVAEFRPGLGLPPPGGARAA